MRTLECVLKINWFVSTILEAWCYWIMEKTAIHIAYSWNKWGNFQWKLIWFSGIPTQNPSVSSYCGQKFRLWSFLSIPPSYLSTSESPAKAANRLLFCHSVSSLRALVPCDKHCPMLFQDTYGSVLIMHLCNLLSLLFGQGSLISLTLPHSLHSTFNCLDVTPAVICDLSLQVQWTFYSALPGSSSLDPYSRTKPNKWQVSTMLT